MRTTRIAPVALLAVLFLSGCAGLQHMPGGGHGGKGRVLACGQSACTVPVTVRGCWIDIDEKLDLGAAPDRVRIVWTLQGGGEFDAAKGIDFRGNPRFANVARDARRWEVTFDNRTKGTRHKYDVNIRGCPTYDPFVMN